ncbi:GTF2H3 [Cordylochernes scorpioides]|uniref:General transcription factor IIH subunit 3 n=1 Tax=Cordylochernes scorpioides TaxID=51811 RepID=A0ABY6KEC2_9ARAC|nr:GTF2H3 [Cordylochernes scorpioides]
MAASDMRSPSKSCVWAEKGNLLVVVIDLWPSLKLVKNQEGLLLQCLEAIISFCSSHLLMNSLNRLVVIGCHTQNSGILYPIPKLGEDNNTHSGQFEKFNELDNTIRHQIQNLVLNRSDQRIYTEALLAGALTRALCYINRIKREDKNLGKLQKNSRILVSWFHVGVRMEFSNGVFQMITSSGDDVSQYLNFINSFYSAQKSSTTIDVCMLENDCGLLRQGADITEGIYLRIPNTEALLQYLLWVFLPCPSSRKSLILPPSSHPSSSYHSTVCFCHRIPIDVGYVCSVCFSIFCTFSPICSTCQTTFKFAAIKPKKKKVKQDENHAAKSSMPSW